MKATLSSWAASMYSKPPLILGQIHMWMEAHLKPQSFPQEHVGLGVDALIPKPRQN